MALQTESRRIETEALIGCERLQAPVRAEALVPGAGREAIEPLLADARLYISAVDVQTDRVVLEGTVTCQAAYRQGEETSLRALTAQAALSQVFDIAGAQPGMLSLAQGQVTHVEAGYENGHMVFQVSCDLCAQVLSLSQEEIIAQAEGGEGLQCRYEALESVRLAASSEELALLRDDVSLPAALDARAALMDWAGVEITEVAADLGGVRVRGRLLVETLLSSGAQGRPAVTVRYPLPLDQLVEMPEWLSAGACAAVDVRSLRSRVVPAENGEVRLSCEAEVRVRVLANAADAFSALSGIYATSGSALEVERRQLCLCTGALTAQVTESIRGTVLIGENAPGAGSVIALQAHPNISQFECENGRGRIEGVMELQALYLTGGTDRPASAGAELPFTLNVDQPLQEDSLIELQVISAEANALMSDRLEVRLQVAVRCATRRRACAQVVASVSEGEPIARRPGIVIVWPEEGEDAWSIGQRYAVAAEGLEAVEAGKPLILKM